MKESDRVMIIGKLPSGDLARASLRVARPHALAMPKLFATDDRYRNIRGPEEAEHDRNKARIHGADFVFIVRANIERPDFRVSFRSQFGDDLDLRDEALGIISTYFANSVAPGILLYAEFCQMQGLGNDRTAEERALREIRLLLSEPVDSQSGSREQT
ncbi:MAG: hypothetical protein QME66_04530 [Candidatus Eisenbacteria bacterium]|nr:hypothetical protein [Candidatus Eisenbacteria bacterium]